MSGLRIIIAGGRDFNDYALMKKELDFLFSKDPPEAILSGGAAGANRMGEVWAKNNSIPLEMHYADWTAHGKAAGYIRNRLMASKANGLVAFWDGQSRGTKNMIEEAEKRGLAVWVVRTDDPNRADYIVQAKAHEDSGA